MPSPVWKPIVRAVLLSLTLCAAPAHAGTVGREQTLQVRAGVVTLAATLTRPERGERAPLVILMPGSERMSRSFYGKVAARFVSAGLAAVVWDRRGEGESGGSWDSTQSITRIADDALLVLQAAKRLPGVDSTAVVVWGLSQGGWSGTRLAATAPNVVAAVLFSDPALPTYEENLNERWWQLQLEQGFSQQEADEITDVRRELWRYYRTGVKPDGFSALWSATQTKPWFERMKWHRYEPTPDSMSAERLADFRRFYDPTADMRGTVAPVLRLYGREDRHIRSDRSLAAARAAYTGMARDTAFRMYDDRGHGLQSTLGAPECPSCPHHGDRFAHGLELDDAVWRDVVAWLEPRLKPGRAAR